MPASSFLQQRSSLGQGLVSFAAGLDTAIQALGSITVNDFDLTFYRRGVYQATLSYVSGGSVHGVVAGEAADDPQNPEGSVEDINALLSTVGRAGIAIRTAAPEESRDVGIKRMLVLYSASSGLSGHPWLQRLLVVQNTSGGAVAADATATMTVVHADGGSTDTVTVRNRSQVSWNANAFGYAYYDDLSSEYFGYVTCCSVP